MSEGDNFKVLKGGDGILCNKCSNSELLVFSLSMEVDVQNMANVSTIRSIYNVVLQGGSTLELSAWGGVKRGNRVPLLLEP